MPVIEDALVSKIGKNSALIDLTCVPVRVRASACALKVTTNCNNNIVC